MDGRISRLDVRSQLLADISSGPAPGPRDPVPGATPTRDGRFCRWLLLVFVLGASGARAEQATTEGSSLRAGWYAAGRGGGFLTVGGARGSSSPQPFVGLELGKELAAGFSAQALLSLGYQSGNPLEDPLACTGSHCSDYHLDFGLTLLNLAGAMEVWSRERWKVEARVGGGLVLIQPAASPESGPLDFDGFAGLRGQYATRRAHLALAIEYDFYLVFPTFIPAMSASLAALYHF